METLAAKVLNPDHGSNRRVECTPGSEHKVVIGF